jgi:hypothetical protein
MLSSALDHLINIAPADEELLTWASREIAGRMVERADGDLKEAALALQLSVAGLRSLLKN